MQNQNTRGDLLHIAGLGVFFLNSLHFYSTKVALGIHVRMALHSFLVHTIKSQGQNANGVACQRRQWSTLFLHPPPVLPPIVYHFAKAFCKVLWVAK